MQSDELKAEKRTILGRLFKSKAFWALVFLGAIVGYGYYLKFKENAAIEAAVKEVAQYDNIEEQILDVSASKNKNKAVDVVKGFGNLTIEDLKEDDDFLYQVLIQNQLDLRKLGSQIKLLEYELAKFKSQAKLQKMIMTYVNLRESIFAGKDYKNQLQSFRLLASSNKILMEDVRSLEELTEGFENFEALNEKLSKLSRTLIAMKKNDPKGGFLEKIRFNIAKVITVRKLDLASEEVDGKIYRLQKALEGGDCELALDEVRAFDEKYQSAVANFKEKLENSCKLRQVDGDIMLYLENLSIVN